MIIKRFQVTLDTIHDITEYYSFLDPDINSLLCQENANGTKKVWGTIKRQYRDEITERTGVSLVVAGRPTAFLLAVNGSDLLDDEKDFVALPCPPFCNGKEAYMKSEIFRKVLATDDYNYIKEIFDSIMKKFN